MLKNHELKRFLAAVDADQIQTVFLIGLEGHTGDPGWSLAQRVIDSLVRHFQPSPVLTHVELLIPPQNKGSETHFSTYYQHVAGWGSSFNYSTHFYLGPVNFSNWRAIPVQAKQLVERLREVCDANVGTPYSISRYPFSVPPFRAIASILSDDACSPAHCAGLSARLLNASSPEIHLKHSSPWYSPSTLFIECAKPERMWAYNKHLDETDHIQSLPEEEEGLCAIETLLRGSNDAVKLLSHRQCVAGTEKLTRDVIRQRADSVVDPVRERILEKQLARALLRWTQLAHVVKV